MKILLTICPNDAHPDTDVEDAKLFDDKMLATLESFLKEAYSKHNVLLNIGDTLNYDFTEESVNLLTVYDRVFELQKNGDIHINYGFTAQLGITILNYVDAGE